MESYNIKNEMNLRILLLKLWDHLNTRRKSELSLYIFIMLASSFAEIISLTAIIPFLAVLTNPEEIFKIKVVNTIANVFSISNPEELRLPITLLFALVVILAGLIRVINLWFTLRIASSIGNDLSTEAYRKLLYQPYLKHISSHSSNSIATINNEVERVVYGVIIPSLLLFSSAIICLFLIATLILIISWKITSFSAITILSFYFLAISLSKKSIKILSRKQVYLHSKIIRIVQESLGSIREIAIIQYYFSDGP